MAVFLTSSSGAVGEWRGGKTGGKRDGKRKLFRAISKELSLKVQEGKADLDLNIFSASK